MRVLSLLALSPPSAAMISSLYHDRGHSNPCPLSSSSSSSSPFTLQPAFTLDLQLGTFPPAIQPPNFNGTVGVLPVVSGTVSGPLLNGTVTSGLGVGYRFSTGYFDDDVNYGQTEDGVEFLFHQKGTGGLSDNKVSRLIVTIGGQYAYLSESFLLQATETNVTASGGTLRGEVFLVGSTLQSG